MESLKIILVVKEGEPLHRTKLSSTLNFKIHCGLGSLLDSLHKFGCPGKIILVVNGSEKIEDPLIEQILFHDNNGLDIGAMARGYSFLDSTGYSGEVLFINTSVSGPNRRNWVDVYRSILRKPGVGLCGISLCANIYPEGWPEKGVPIFQPHVQSFFMFTHTKILIQCFPQGLPCPSTQNKQKVIEEGEVSISQSILDAGYGICCRMFPDFIYHQGDPWSISEAVQLDSQFQFDLNQI